MNILLIFFAIPLAVIILSAILETFVHCPFKVAGIFFAIFIVVAFALGGTATLIVAAIIYTLISFLTAAIVRFLINRMCTGCEDERTRCRFCRDECITCVQGNAFRMNNEFNNTLRTLNDFNAGNGFYNEDINQFARENQNNILSTNNTCRRSR